ncbi:glycosyltransferase [Peribacillus simplex]|uniref:tetratricopeptide repeat-containing glycosyltransferase family 2 protein n=1 Tax=Peribacillus simplex TaxID=1478 RepID=UPI002041FA25|nr:TPR domain-containing glycosyltransferase [Peribacillus simplex]MCM3677008.1 glycosyltransferase [Peribacillus simplex]
MHALDISLCMIVKNEVAHLEHCLNSVHSLVSEIIVGDTGSEDGSIDIARQFGARVIPIKWEQDFAKARNTVLEQATCSWILVLDADEIAANWDIAELEKLLADTSVYGYYVQMISYVGEAESQEFITDSVCRLFRNNPCIRFRGRIHEEVSQSILEFPGSPLLFSKLKIDHYGYLKSEIDRKDKAHRNQAIIQEALKDAPQDFMLRYALATEYFQIDEYDEAANILLSLLDTMDEGPGYISDLYLKAAYSLYMLGDDNHASEVIKKGLSHYADFSDLYELQASLLLRQGRTLDAYKTLQTSLRLGDVSAIYSSSSGCGTYRTHYLAGRIYESLHNFEEASEHYERALSFRPDYLPAWGEFVALELLMDRSFRLTNFLAKHPESMNQKQLSILIPSVLNSRAKELLKFLLFESECGRLPLPPLLNILYLFQNDEDEHACNKLRELMRESPADQKLVDYLWAAAWKRLDMMDAKYLAGLYARGPLASIQQKLEGENKQILSSSDVSLALQMFIQVGAWDAIVAMYRHSGSELRWTNIPLPLLCGLSQAPTLIKKELCSVYENLRREIPPKNMADCNELLVFTWLAQSCGTILNVPDSFSFLSDHFTAYAGTAYHQLAKASFYHRLPCEFPDLRLILRASCSTDT